MTRTMRRPVIPILMLAFATGLIAAAEGLPADPRAQLQELAFLKGRWSGEMWGGEFRTVYSGPSGGAVLSYSEVVRDGEVGFHEFERFEPADGRVVFHPYPGGRPATPMPLVAVERDAAASTGRAVFEEPEKDFPTRIEYARVAEGRLVITLSDPHGDTEEARAKKQVFDLRRVER